MLGENSQSCPTEGVKLTKSLIARRNQTVSMDQEKLESISQGLTSLQILRLDRERISHITNLEGLEQIHSIYLQQNQIQKIENLSCFPNLKFLSLAGNQISKVENLLCLLKLQFLDLSQNCIETLDIDELPQSLVVLDLTGNKCTNRNGYRESVLAALPLLKELDAKSIPSRKTPVKKEEDDSSGDSDYEDCPELSHPLSAGKDFFVDFHEEFTSRSRWRRENAVREHEARLEELEQQQKLRQLIFNTSQSSPKAPSRSEPLAPAQEDNILQTEYQTASNTLLKTANSSFSTRATKGKCEGTSHTQLKTLKVASSAKTTSKRKK
ncbi:leucine-rich repeat-containing protein 46 [Sceloporus undulatus]|uniref:leucine-rich repeat-containing protein 46 n=1 Tax=Sceloporus undulatus TaxID=8520 RepID=UPI001C4C6258|nr:leucine-rich repeat-containing protein 46 [Sceloporus undulatus]XP_042330329.1 leucine-rich repeat-containing protein 46 [Sceloporus undulatus]XP_042330330.1 leucine-rich repeat-containing protein 46 [Sceloporus undulatus]